MLLVSSGKHLLSRGRRWGGNNWWSRERLWGECQRIGWFSTQAGIRRKKKKGHEDNNEWIFLWQNIQGKTASLSPTWTSRTRNTEQLNGMIESNRGNGQGRCLVDIASPTCSQNKRWQRDACLIHLASGRRSIRVAVTWVSCMRHLIISKGHTRFT